MADRVVTGASRGLFSLRDFDFAHLSYAHILIATTVVRLRALIVIGDVLLRFRFPSSVVTWATAAATTTALAARSPASCNSGGEA